ncbi:MAG: uroporphyrinogen decarboxylase family protein [Halanaerobiaceae bacterium]
MEITPLREKWPGKMTDRERFNRQMHYKSVDRSFNREFGYWDENFEKWKMFKENNITNNQEGHRLFNFDRIEDIGGNVWMSPTFDYKVIEETENKKVIRNAEGLIAEVPKDGHDTIPHFVDSTIKTPQDWEKVKKERFNRDDPARKVDIDRLKERHPENRDYPLGVNCGSMIGKIRDMLTFEGLAYAVHDYPEMVDDMVETCCLLVEDFLDQVLPHFDFDFASGWEDICFKSGPIVSVDFFRDVVVPRYKRIGAKLHKADIDLWYTDCDGDIRPILPYMMEAGINCMFPFEVNSSGHPGKLLDEYGKELRIMGGVDKMALGKGKEEIKEYMESLVPYVKNRGGFIPHVDHRCPPDVDEEDYLYYLDLKKELLGSGPINF